MDDPDRLTIPIHQWRRQAVEVGWKEGGGGWIVGRPDVPTGSGSHLLGSSRGSAGTAHPDPLRAPGELQSVALLARTVDRLRAHLPTVADDDGGEAASRPGELPGPIHQEMKDALEGEGGVSPGRRPSAGGAD